MDHGEYFLGLIRIMMWNSNHSEAHGALTIPVSKAESLFFEQFDYLTSEILSVRDLLLDGMHRGYWKLTHDPDNHEEIVILDRPFGE